MNKRVKFTTKEKMFFVLKFRELNIPLSAFCRLYNIERTAIHRWSIKYNHSGLEALQEVKVKITYSLHILINSVEDYLTGKFLMLQIVKKIILKEYVN